MARKNFTLSIDEDLSQRMKLQAIREKRDVSTITEELYADYLARFERFERAMAKPRKKT